MVFKGYGIPIVTGQIILRFEIQKDAIVFPKSTNPERIKSNLEVFDAGLCGEADDA